MVLKQQIADAKRKDAPQANWDENFNQGVPTKQAKIKPLLMAQIGILPVNTTCRTIAELLASFTPTHATSLKTANIFPSARYMAEKTGKSRSTIKRAILCLEDMGWIEVDDAITYNRQKNGYTSNRYWFTEKTLSYKANTIPEPEPKKLLRASRLMKLEDAPLAKVLPFSRPVLRVRAVKSYSPLRDEAHPVDGRGGNDHANIFNNTKLFATEQSSLESESTAYLSPKKEINTNISTQPCSPTVKVLNRNFRFLPEAEKQEWIGKLAIELDSPLRSYENMTGSLWTPKEIHRFVRGMFWNMCVLPTESSVQEVVRGIKTAIEVMRLHPSMIRDHESINRLMHWNDIIKADKAHRYHTEKYICAQGGFDKVVRFYTQDAVEVTKKWLGLNKDVAHKPRPIDTMAPEPGQSFIVSYPESFVNTTRLEEPAPEIDLEELKIWEELLSRP